MNRSRRNPAAGGLLILVGFLGGAVIGIARGEPSLGVLAGVGVGMLLALALWLFDRTRA